MLPAIAGSGRKTEPVTAANIVKFSTPPGISIPRWGWESPAFFFGDSHEKNHPKQAREASSEDRNASYASSQDWPDERTGH